MKTLLFSICSMILLSVSCDKETTSPTNFEGKWVVKKAYADPGNGSGRYQDVPGNQSITFNANGSASSDFVNFGFGMLKSYMVVDTVQVKFLFTEASSQPTTTYRYKFAGDTLILNPPCIEGCGIKLVKAK